MLAHMEVESMEDLFVRASSYQVFEVCGECTSPSLPFFPTAAPWLKCFGRNKLFVPGFFCFLLFVHLTSDKCYIFHYTFCMWIQVLIHASLIPLLYAITRFGVASCFVAAKSCFALLRLDASHRGAVGG